MQTESQFDGRELLGTAEHRLRDPHGRPQSLRWRRMKQLRSHQRLERRIEVLFVVKWLAHPHKNDVANRAFFGRQKLSGEQYLVEDLVSRQIAGHSHLARRAKLACRGATDLAGNAQR